MRGAFLALLLIHATHGCRASKSGVATGDAAAEASTGIDASPAAAAAVAEPELALVASGTSIRLTVTPEGRLVVDNEMLLWEAKADGTLEPLVEPAGATALVPEDDALAGYETAWQHVFVEGRLAEGLRMPASRQTQEEKTFTIRDRKLVEAVGTPRRLPRAPPLHVWEDDAKARELPDGTSAAIARTRRETSFVAWRDERTERVVPLDDAKTTCEILSSFDGAIYTACHESITRTSYRRIDGVRALPAFKDAPTWPGATAIAWDGRIFRAKDGVVEACTGDGTCTSRKVPDVPLPEMPRYWLADTDVVDAKGRSWRSLEVWAGRASRAQFDRAVVAIAPRARGDLWVLLRKSGGFELLHTGAPRPPVVVPSPIDVRVMIMNTRPPARWSRGCDVVFVRLGRDADVIAQRERDLDRALAGVGWSFVEGTLGGEDVTGVVVSRPGPLDKPTVLDDAVRRVIAAFATGPANEPPAYCTPPVLKRVVLPRPR